MTYDARQIANWFVERANKDGKPLSIMSLLKLTYIAHGWHIEMFKRPLFGNSIEAWQYGPVIPDVYKAFRRQGVIIKSIVESQPKLEDQHTLTFLDQVYSSYGHLSPFKLSDLTHEANSPWDIARKRYGDFGIIDNDTILQHYTEKRSQYANPAVRP